MDAKRYESKATLVNQSSLFTRRLKVFTWLSIGFATGYMIFFNDYGAVLDGQTDQTKARGHVFSDLQQQMRAILRPTSQEETRKSTD